MSRDILIYVEYDGVLLFSHNRYAIGEEEFCMRKLNRYYMKTEYEASFLAIDKDRVRSSLKSMGATCTHTERLMKRVVFEHPSDPRYAYLRVRDEGDKVTCTLKETLEGEKHIESVRELETGVDDFDTMKNIFIHLGLQQKSYQETLRETWALSDGVEAMIDTWPGLNPFIEIEGENEALVQEYSKKLGFNYDEAIFGTVGAVYLKELGISGAEINSIPVITFENPPKIKNQN